MVAPDHQGGVERIGSVGYVIERLMRSLQKPVVMAFYTQIALARLFAEPLQVSDLNTAAGVIDEAKLLQFMGYIRNTGALEAKHLRKKFLSEWDRILIGQISRP